MIAAIRGLGLLHMSGVWSGLLVTPLLLVLLGFFVMAVVLIRERARRMLCPHPAHHVRFTQDVKNHCFRSACMRCGTVMSGTPSRELPRRRWRWFGRDS